MTLAGKKIMITGGTRGLGAAMSVAAANMGAEVWVLGRGEDALDAVASQSDRIYPVQQDIAADDAAQQAFSILTGLLIAS